jgi:hypothetical protein
VKRSRKLTGAEILTLRQTTEGVLILRKRRRARIESARFQRRAVHREKMRVR